MHISDIRQQLDILGLVQQYGLQPNRNNMVICPFHQDDKPSLQLYPKTNTWHCFGCGKGTDVIDFIQLKEDVTKHKAITKAKSFLGASEKLVRVPEEKPTLKELAPSERVETLTRAFTYFVRGTKGRDSKPKEYLNGRNLDPEKLTVGFDAHLFHSKVTEEQKQEYLSLGLIYPDKLGRVNNYHSLFDGCVVFPMYNEKNEIVNLYGRCTDETNKSKHRYLPGKHTGLYPGYPKAETQTIILTECIIDTATLQSLSPDVLKSCSLISLYGTNGLTTEHIHALQNLKHLKEIILFFDGDQAGKEANEKHSKYLKDLFSSVKISIVATPENEDINSLSVLYGENASAFIEDLINKRVSFLSSENKEPESIPQTTVGTSFEKKKSDSSDNTSVSAVKSLNAASLSSLNIANPEQLIFKDNWLTATVWGGIDLYNIKKLRATLHLQSLSNEYLEYRDTVDLYSNTHTQRLIREASEKLETGTMAMTKSISALTKELEGYRQKQREQERKRQAEEKERGKEIFSSEQLRAAEQFLKSKSLMKQTESHIQNIGLVGEEEKGMLLFFILLTRLFQNPLHALVQGKSGSGKTYLLKCIAGLIPKAHCQITTALTENTLYHSSQGYWKHKILLIEDLDGVLSALLPLREMMSNQSISKISTEKNLKTGEFEPKLLYVEGPVCVAGATTKDKIYEDNANRSFLIQVNESSEHQQRVLEYQRKEIAGLLDKSKQVQTQTLFKAAQLHLQPMEVIIPFGDQLRIPDYVFKKLRTNAHYLTLIKAIAFWHQKQREIKEKEDGTRYIEATLKDVAWANKLSREVLLRKSDELNGALRGFFESIKAWMKSQNMETFQAKPLRERFRMNPMQVNRYLRELEQRNYIKQAGGNRKTGFEYTVTVWNDYEQLQSGLSILDEVLEQLKAKSLSASGPLSSSPLSKKESITQV